MNKNRAHPNLWYPFSITEGQAPPPKVVRGRGTTLELEDGRIILDCISSWWVNLHGHGNLRIADAIHEQAERLEHVLFAGFTHEPAERLARALTDQLPGPLSRVFYSDDGSTSVEVALKMALQFWRNQGERRTSFIAFDGAYHGDTFGAMSAGARSLFTDAFGELLFDVDHVPYPATWMGDASVEQREDETISRIEALLTEAPGRHAAIIVEPLVQGAGGMRVCREAFLQKLAAVQSRFGTLLIFDEVMTGFGRTGDWFACRRAGVEPDLICLAKGITGGFVPLAATVATSRIYEAFTGAGPERTFWHGHSYTANPIGCAAALASLELMAENEPVFSGMEEHHRGFLARLDPEDTTRHRVMGTIAAFDVRTEEEGGYLNRVGDQIKRLTLDRGLLLRPLGNTLYVMPPYSLTEEERESMYVGIEALVQEVT